jgi:hypothetical protein
MSMMISDELAGFLESGLAITIATRDADLEPDGGWAWAARVHEDRASLTLFVHERSAPALLRNLQSHPEIAIAFDLPSSHRACQVKGRFTASRRARPGERAEIERQAQAFVVDLESIGIPQAMTAGWKCWPSVAIELRVTQLFEQTPGPGAGEPMR